MPTKTTKSCTMLKPKVKPGKQLAPQQRSPSPFVWDMFCATSPQALLLFADEKSGEAERIVRRGIKRLIKALSKASKKSPIVAAVNQPVGDDPKDCIRIEYDVTVKKESQADGTKDFIVFTLKAIPRIAAAAETDITIRISRDRQAEPADYRVQIQSNPIPLFTGQNAWPMESIFGSLRHDLAFQLGWPYLLVLAVCKQVSANFKPSQALARCFMGGKALVDNAQFALSIDAALGLKQVMLALLEQTYQTRRVRFDGTQLGSYALGKWLRIKARCYERAKSGVPTDKEKIQTTIIVKGSGDHCMGSLSFYDKGEELGLSANEARLQGFSEQLRLEVTLQARGIAKVVTEAIRIAGANKVKTSLGKVGKRSPRENVDALIEAIAIIDSHFSATFDGKKVQGFPAWLVRKFVQGEFFLGELFGHTDAKWVKLVRFFDELAKKDKRYGEVFKAWCACDEGRAPLRKRLLQIGLPAGSVDRHMKQVRELGFSGRVPPMYFKDREVLWLSYGASDKDFYKLAPRLKAGKSVEKILARSGANIQPAFVALQTAITSAADQSAVPCVAVGGRVIPPSVASKSKDKSLNGNQHGGFVKQPRLQFAEPLPRLVLPVRKATMSPVKPASPAR